MKEQKDNQAGAAEFQSLVGAYYSTKVRLDSLKAEFNKSAAERFDQTGRKSEVFEFDGLGEESSGYDLQVNKIEKTSIEWDASKLERKVTKDVARQVIRKTYRIADMRGLAKYLKSCGVDPREFKKYLVIDKVVDQDAVDQLGSLGKLSVRNISGCYNVKCHKPYFSIIKKKRKVEASDDTSKSR